MAKTICSDKRYQEMISYLPQNYNFELEKCIEYINKHKIERVGLQFPEGLLLFAPIIADILSTMSAVEVVILGDVTYGACCVDDVTAKAMGCNLLIHYGHSCLIPIQNTCIRVLYIFVLINIPITPLTNAIKNYIPIYKKIVVVSTVQYLIGGKQLVDALKDLNISQPRERPLSKGEILGCTSPKLEEGVDLIIYIGDGRFHLESIMIKNPGVMALRYDPYTQTLTEEVYEIQEMHRLRQLAINDARTAKKVGIIQSTLGRQGNPLLTKRIKDVLDKANIDSIIFLVSEITPEKLDHDDIDAWVQIGCPRLSIDWGSGFEKPLLNPYEAMVSWGQQQYLQIYPMDYYSSIPSPWNNA